MNSISFTFFRHNIDPNLNLQVQVGIAGTAILGVDYSTLDFDSITNLSSMSIATLVIPAGVDSRKVVCTATPGLVQADRTVTLIVQPQPEVLTVDPIAPQATGILTFPGSPVIPPINPVNEILWAQPTYRQPFLSDPSVDIFVPLVIPPVIF